MAAEKLISPREMLRALINWHKQEKAYLDAEITVMTVTRDHHASEIIRLEADLGTGPEQAAPGQGEPAGGEDRA